MTQIQITETKWIPLREAFRQFLEGHPELGIKFSENVFRNFSRIYTPELMEVDAVRKPYKTSPAIAHIERFDKAAFEVMTKREVETA